MSLPSLSVLSRGWRGVAGVAVLAGSFFLTGCAHEAKDASTPPKSRFLTTERLATPTPADYTGWQLVWQDEFDYTGAPDPAKWTYERGFVRNQELQWYQPENATCRDGLLVIEARREKKKNPRYQPDSKHWGRAREFAEYTSASITTKGMQGWTYGRFEARARIDVRQGMWPAFWSVGTGQGWPHNGEIDIMEFYQKTLLANVAWGGTKPGQAVWHTVKTPLERFNDPAWAGKFHVWRMDWDDKFIRLYVDDILLNETDLSQTENQNGAGNPFIGKPQFIILNLAVGSTGGDPSETTFPARFEVDYVRIYQRK